MPSTMPRGVIITNELKFPSNFPQISNSNWHAIADPGNIVRSMADAAMSQSKNDNHVGGEGTSDGEVIGRLER